MKDDGSRGYYSLLIAHKDSKINSLEDVLKCDNSLTFSNGDPNSTSGFVIPGYYVWGLSAESPKPSKPPLSLSSRATTPAARPGPPPIDRKSAGPAKAVSVRYDTCVPN